METENRTLQVNLCLTCNSEFDNGLGDVILRCYRTLIFYMITFTF